MFIFSLLLINVCFVVPFCNGYVTSMKSILQCGVSSIFKPTVTVMNMYYFLIERLYHIMICLRRSENYQKRLARYKTNLLLCPRFYQN